MADWQQLNQQVQGRWEQLHSDLIEKTYEAQAGGGLVWVTVDGKGMIRSLHLDPAVYQDRDADLLSDLVLGAVAEAQRRASEALQQAVTRLPSLPPISPL